MKKSGPQLPRLTTEIELGRMDTEQAPPLIQTDRSNHSTAATPRRLLEEEIVVVDEP